MIYTIPISKLHSDCFRLFFERGTKDDYLVDHHCIGRRFCFGRTRLSLIILLGFGDKPFMAMDTLGVTGVAATTPSDRI